MKTSFVKILLLNLACLSGAWSAAAGQPATNTESVKLVADGKTFLKFRCNNGYVHVLELQLEGKKRMSVEEFLRGWRR